MPVSWTELSRQELGEGIYSADRGCILRGSLRKRRFTAPVTDVIAAMVVNRLLEPMSKLAVDEWVREDVYFTGSEKLELQHYYRALVFWKTAKTRLKTSFSGRHGTFSTGG